MATTLTFLLGAAQVLWLVTVGGNLLEAWHQAGRPTLEEL